MNSPDYHNPDSFLVRMAWVTFAGESWGSRVCDMIWLPFMLRRIIKTQKNLLKMSILRLLTLTVPAFFVYNHNLCSPAIPLCLNMSPAHSNA